MRTLTQRKYHFAVHNHSGVFHKCEACGKEWRTKQEFLKDRRVSLSNYSSKHDGLYSVLADEEGLVFVHRERSCGKFFKITADNFRDRERGPSMVKTR
jgi:DNA-directed RNA polymerase subunit M/transcription elongation factor TFIIS